MYEFQEESERIERRYKAYLFVFIITVLINTFIDLFDLGIEKVSIYRTVISLLVYSIIFYFALRRKLWANLMIKFFVWLNIFIFFLFVTVKILELWTQKIIVVILESGAILKKERTSCIDLYFRTNTKCSFIFYVDFYRENPYKLLISIELYIRNNSGRFMMRNIGLDELDNEWLQLVDELMKANISKSEFRQFLELKKLKKKINKKGVLFESSRIVEEHF